MNKTLREKLMDIFDTYYTDGDSNKAIIADLNRRGKIDNKKILDVLFMLIEEIEELKKPEIEPKKSSSTKTTKK